MSQVTNNIKLEVGQKYGRLTAIACKHIVDNRKRVLWVFRCDCGNEVNVSASDVRLGRKRSCGCLGQERKDTLGDRLRIVNTKPDKQGPLNKLFGNYKRAARRRNYGWMLSKEDFKKLISQKCFYCDAEPSTGIWVARKQTVENTLIYNGVDRKNNEEDYTLDNCIPACFTCNRMKMDLSFENFMDKIHQIHTKHYE